MQKSKKLISIILCILMLVSSVSIVSQAEFGKTDVKSSLSFTTLSDPHIFPDSLTGNNCAAYQEYCKGDAKLYAQSESMVRTAIETMVIRNPELKYVLVPGDLTKDSEYEAHTAFADIMKDYEEKYGLEFIVTPGNHDINSPNASTFNSGKKEKGRAITAAEFREVYADYGYDLAGEEYVDYLAEKYPEKSTDVRNKLSYYVDLEGDYRLIVLDSNVYAFGTPDKGHTEGEVTEETMAWVEKVAKEGTSKGKTLIMMLHHSLAPHMEVEPSITFAFPLNDYMEAAEKFASWGIHYAFTGHLHTNDIAATINDDGEVIYDCETASVTGYPCSYREMTISTFKDGESEMSFQSVSFDAAKEYTYNGVTYEKNTYKNHAFDICFGGNLTEDGKADAVMFLTSIANGFLKKYVEQMRDMGSIDAFLKSMDLDLEKIIGGFLEPYIGEGIAVGGYNIFSVDNIMWFVNDLLGQIFDLYIKDPQKLYDLIESVVRKLGDLELSEYPCDAFVDTLGFGSKTEKGNLADLILDVMAYWYTGNEDSSKDKFLKDVIARLKTGELTELLFDTIVDILLNDIVDEALLSKLEIRLGKLFGKDGLTKVLGDGVDYLVNVLLQGNTSYMNLVNLIFELEVLPYKDVYDTLDQLLISRYLTKSQFEGTGTFIAFILNDFTTDVNPFKEKNDDGVTYSTRPVATPVSRENYRLPTMVSVTMGEDSETEANISWFSKYSVGGDIEIYKADSEPTFKGEATEGITVTTERIRRSYPGIDVGVIGFITYEFPMNRHIVKLTDLEPGSTYYYRVGDAERDWWSETGTIKTADGGKNTTFFHMTDPQSQSKEQYERAWATITETAFDLYPDASFIINTGDHVDREDNTKQWQWMFDTASKTLMNTYMMPTAGNHEEKGEYALTDNFVLPNVPEQDHLTGTYYSFDYNNVHIAVINSNNLGEDEGLSAAQIEWLTEDLKKSDAQWKFVALHKAPYSQGSHYKDDDVCAIRAQLQSLMPTLDVDMVFQGHDHVYMRTGSLVNNGLTAYDKTYLNHDGEVYRTQIKPDGTTYVISGTSGVKTYLTNDITATDKYFPRGEKMLAVDAPMFSTIEIEDGVLYFTAYSVTDGKAEAVDRFAIQKNENQGDVNTEYKEPAVEEEKTNSFFDTINSVIKTLKKILKVVTNIFKIYFIKPIIK